MQPVYKITADDQNITDIVSEYFVSMNIKDSSGLDSDSFTLVLSAKEKYQWPRKGVVLKVWLGYQSKGLHYKGAFIVNELDYSSPPNQISIHCTAADLGSMGRYNRITKQWGTITLGDICKTIANKYNLIPALSADLQDQLKSEVYQVNESDLNFLARLSNDHGAIAQVKNGSLILVRKGAVKTASGERLPLIDINLSDISKHTYNERGDEEYTAIKVWYRVTETYTYNLPNGFPITLKYPRHYSVKVGAGSAIKNIAADYNNKDDALIRAEAEFNSIAGSASTLSLTLRHGKPELLAEFELDLTGFIDQINRLTWVASEITHTLNGSGLSSTIKAVRPSQFNKPEPIQYQ